MDSVATTTITQSLDDLLKARSHGATNIAGIRKNVADVLNYVRNNFGNKNERAITPEFVGKVRAEFAGRDAQWTEAELLKFPPAK